MRIVHVSHTASPGGAELALRRLLLAQHAWSAAVCAPSGGDAFDESVGRAEFDLTMPGFPTGGTRGGNPLLAARYVAALRSNARALGASSAYTTADLVHANTALAGIVSAMAARPRSRPLVLHLRDFVSPESLGRFGFVAFTRIALRRCTGVIANSRATLDSASELLPANTIRTVLQSPSGITARVAVPLVRESVGAVAMIGRLQRWKGQHIFLRAFAAVFAGTSVRALIAGAPMFGEEEFEAELGNLVREHGIEGQVDFLGHVADVRSLLKRVDVLVHASIRSEPLGQSILQGLAAAIPVVATQGGGPSELIAPEENGLLVAPDSVDALAAALRRLAESRELRARLAAGAARHPGVMTDDECAEAHAEFFQSVRAAPSARDRTR